VDVVEDPDSWGSESYQGQWFVDNAKCVECQDSVSFKDAADDLNLSYRNASGSGLRDEKC
jgi:hypothetical protein